VSRPSVVVPSLGSPHLAACLEAVTRLDPPPAQVVVVLSGAHADIPCPDHVHAIRQRRRLGFAAAVNGGLAALPEDCELVALLNDDAVPEPTWLPNLAAALLADPELAAVQGTVSDADGLLVDGRGITLDRYGLPVQVDRGAACEPEPAHGRTLLAVSGTAAMLRLRALRAAELAPGVVFDPRFGSYHEDLDLGLRLGRLGWRAAWVPGAVCCHLGSATANALRWRHPWWVLANRWRALAGNLRWSLLVASLPRLLRGELRAARTLARYNPRAVVVAAAVVAAAPVLIAAGLARPSPGVRLDQLPWGLRCASPS